LRDSCVLDKRVFGASPHFTRISSASGIWSCTVLSWWRDSRAASKTLTTRAPRTPSERLAEGLESWLLEMQLTKWVTSTLSVLLGVMEIWELGEALRTAFGSEQSTYAMPLLPTTVTSRRFSRSSQLTSTCAVKPP